MPVRVTYAHQALAVALSVQWQGKDDVVRGIPVVALKDARDQHYAARKTLAAGVDPMAERKAKSEAQEEEIKARRRESESSFEKVAREWWNWWSDGKSPRHADVFPGYGHKPIDTVTVTDIRTIFWSGNSKLKVPSRPMAAQTGAAERLSLHREG